jgi:glutamate/tyrosine decarboxylase-like PLP-dependent enzyme
VAARFDAQQRLGKSTAGWAFVCSSEAHSSLKTAARVMDVQIVVAKSDSNGQLSGAAVAEAIESTQLDVFAVVATGGTTNFGNCRRGKSERHLAARRWGLWVGGHFGW